MSSETLYFVTRAAEERTRAAASNGKVAQIHHELAERYETLAKRSATEPTLLFGWDRDGSLLAG